MSKKNIEIAYVMGVGKIEFATYKPKTNVSKAKSHVSPKFRTGK